jgi:hypothetical protein
VTPSPTPAPSQATDIQAILSLFFSLASVLVGLFVKNPQHLATAGTILKSVGGVLSSNEKTPPTV